MVPFVTKLAEANLCKDDIVAVLLLRRVGQDLSDVGLRLMQATHSDAARREQQCGNTDERSVPGGGAASLRLQKEALGLVDLAGQ